MELDEENHQIDDIEYVNEFDQFRTNKKENGNNFEQDIYLNVSKHQLNANLNVISKEHEINIQQQEIGSSFNKEDVNNYQTEINESNKDNNNLLFNIPPFSSIRNELTNENMIPNNPQTSKLDTLIKVNENFKEVYSLLNSEIKVVKKENKNICQSNTISPIPSHRNKERNTSNISISELLSKNINEVKQMKFKSKQPIPFTKRKMSLLYNEITKLTERNLQSKSIGPYLRNNNSNIQVKNNQKENTLPNKNFIPSKTKSMQHFFKIPKQEHIEDDSFYYPHKNPKDSPHQFNNIKLRNNKSHEDKINIYSSSRPLRTFTSVDKWIEKEINPNSFYKEKERTIKTLLTSVHGYSFRNDYSILNKTSSRDVHSNKHPVYEPYTYDFYSNELNSFTKRLHNQGNKTMDENKLRQRMKNKQKANYSNMNNASRSSYFYSNKNRENKSSEGIVPFYRINLYKQNAEKITSKRLFH